MYHYPEHPVHILLLWGIPDDMIFWTELPNTFCVSLDKNVLFIHLKLLEIFQTSFPNPVPPSQSVWTQFGTCPAQIPVFNSRGWHMAVPILISACLAGPVTILHPLPLSLAVDRDQACGLDIVKQLRGDTDTYVSPKNVGYHSVYTTP